MSHTRTLERFLLLAALSLAPVACGDSDSTGPDSGRRAVDLKIEPSFVRINAVGDTVQLTAVVLDQFGDPIGDATVTWSSLDAGVASVDSEGKVVSKGIGTARIVATSGSLSDEIAVLVSPVVASVTLSVPKTTLAEGESVQFAVVVADSNDVEIPNVPVTWTSSDPVVASVDATGHVTGLWGEASATITATAGGVSASAEIRVLGKIASVVWDDLAGGRLYTMNTDGSDERLLVGLDSVGGQPRWSPDGKRIVFTSFAGGWPAVYTINADGAMLARLTSGIDARNPAFSPNGSKIVFACSFSVTFDICTMNADGTDLAPILTESSYEDYPAWSPDGSKIVFASTRDGGFALFVMNADGSDTPQRITDTNLGDNPFPMWSPDGSKILYVVETLDGFELWVVEADGSNPTKLSSDGEHVTGASWTPDGRIVYAATPEGYESFAAIFIMDADGSNVVQLTDFESQRSWPS